MGAILGTALLVTLTRPATWLLALAAFLIRGGIVWFLAPILVLPTPVGLSNLLGPTIVDFVFGGLSPGLFALMFLGVGIVVGWVVVGGLAAAAIEIDLIGIVAADEEVAPVDATHEPAQPHRDRTLRVLAVRLIALAPLGTALAVATTRIVSVTYAELTLPSSSTPIVWRVLQAVPDAGLLIMATWVVGEVVAAIAARRVVLGDPSLARAVGGAVRDAIRHPIAAAGSFLLPTFALVLVIVPAAAAAIVSWTALRSALVDGAGPLTIAVALIAFVGLWAGGLILAGAVCAWRQAVWTVASVPSGRGTFGGSGNRRPGDWNAAGSSGTL